MLRLGGGESGGEPGGPSGLCGWWMGDLGSIEREIQPRNVRLLSG